MYLQGPFLLKLIKCMYLFHSNLLWGKGECHAKKHRVQSKFGKVCYSPFTFLLSILDFLFIS